MSVTYNPSKAHFAIYFRLFSSRRIRTLSEISYSNLFFALQVIVSTLKTLGRIKAFAAFTYL